MAEPAKAFVLISFLASVLMLSYAALSFCAAVALALPLTWGGPRDWPTAYLDGFDGWKTQVTKRVSRKHLLAIQFIAPQNMISTPRLIVVFVDR